MTQQIVSDEEAKAVICAIAQAHEGITEEALDFQATKFIRWIERTRTDTAMQQLVLNGKITVRWNHELEDWILTATNNP